MKHLRGFFFCFFAVIATPFPAVAEEPVTVFAAASLRGSLDDVAAAYKGDLIISYGGSGQIARQIDQGAPADIAILANVAWMDWLVEKGSTGSSKPLELLGNSLVLVGQAGEEPLGDVSAAAMLARLNGGRIAIGQTEGVPAGIYARQWLEKAGFWNALAPHLAETENVRTALALVARGETPLGIVYATDARAEPDVVILYDVPGDMHEPILYQAVLIDRKNAVQAADLFAFLSSGVAADVFRAHGFRPLSDSR